MKITQMLGYKLFKKIEDSEELDLIRIIGLRQYKNGYEPKDTDRELTVKHLGNGFVEKVKVNQLKGYSPLEPDGICTFNIVTVMDGDGKPMKDVIVTGSKFLNIRVGDTMPYAVCRQNITDIFRNLTAQSEDKMMVGLSINRDTCPSNFDYGIMMACNKIEYCDFVNFYRSDTLEDILSMVKLLKFDTVLEHTYKIHIETVGNPVLKTRMSHGGWCRNIKTLLFENNFQFDLDQMLGITKFDFDITKHLVTKQFENGVDYTTCTDELKGWICHIFKLNITEISFVEYNHDINLAEFNNATYFFIRDINNKLYFVPYNVEGEYYESDLVEEDSKKDFSSEFRIKFYNKYIEGNKGNNTQS